MPFVTTSVYLQGTGEKRELSYQLLRCALSLLLSATLSFFLFQGGKEGKLISVNKDAYASPNRLLETSCIVSLLDQWQLCFAKGHLPAIQRTLLLVGQERAFRQEGYSNKKRVCQSNGEIDLYFPPTPYVEKQLNWKKYRKRAGGLKITNK